MHDHRPLSVSTIAERSAVVGIIGLGYVGLPLALTFHEAGFQVIGFDTDAAKIGTLARGGSYLKHLGEPRIAAAVASGRFEPSSAVARLGECDALIICVPTPLDRHLQPDLRFITDTVDALAPHLRSGALVALESTTWPGTTAEVVGPRILSARPELRLGETLHLCFSPEREDPGNQQYTTRTIPKLVGADHPSSQAIAVALYQAAISAVVPVSGTRVAEMTKLFENIFRSVNIALVNEMKVILDRMGLDVWEVIRAAATKPFGFMSFYPGPGLGGHCIPLDPYYFSWKAKEFGFSARFVELAGEINRGMPRYVVHKVQDCLNQRDRAVKGSRILILGLAYKPDVDDVRESPSLDLIDLLEARGARVAYHDPHIPVILPSREHGHIAGRTSQPLSADYDCFVLATHHRIFIPAEVMAWGVPVVDTRHAMPDGPLVVRA
jgi:UDP-N-acetyl-D-glucosamine dehydrogenase